jgi:phosphate:Na+ symporter
VKKLLSILPVLFLAVTVSGRGPIPDAIPLVLNYAGSTEIVIVPGDLQQAHTGNNAEETVIVRKSNWVVLMCIGLFGGLSLFILGMGMMSEGMQNSAGNRMRNILGRLTGNRMLALTVGTLVTMIIQSSSATNVMLVSFVNSKLMRFRQTIGIILGAALGTTITAQIIAFNITDYALLFVSLGLAFHLIAKRKHIKEIGKAVLGFGILFFGMHVMSDSMSPLRTYDPFIEMILKLENPIAGIIAGALLTALIQSSSAFIGILIILSMQGLLTLNAAIPLLIGANIGTAITAILASLTASRESRQVALAHTLIKATGALLVVFFIPQFTELIGNLSPSGEPHTLAAGPTMAQPRQIANAHTLFNIALCLVFLPVTNLFGRAVERIYPAGETATEAFKVRFMEPGLITTPVLALDAAREELVRMMKRVYQMSEKILEPFLTRSMGAILKLEKAREEVLFLRDSIVDYVLLTTQRNVAAESAEEGYIIMNAVKEFEQIAGVIALQIKAKAEVWCSGEYVFSDSGKHELIRYHQRTLGILEQAINVYKNFNVDKAIRLKSKYDEYRVEYFDMEQQHFERLRSQNEASLLSSKTHLELITLLRVISSYAANTSRILIYRTNRNHGYETPK